MELCLVGGGVAADAAGGLPTAATVVPPCGAAPLISGKASELVLFWAPRSRVSEISGKASEFGHDLFETDLLASPQLEQPHQSCDSILETLKVAVLLVM